MYISGKFKCQLRLNWHLNLIEVCATQSYRFLTFLFHVGPVFETEFGKNQTAMTKSHHLSLFEPPKRKELKNQNINNGNF
jgi:hypothetical protein